MPHQIGMYKQPIKDLTMLEALTGSRSGYKTI